MTPWAYYVDILIFAVPEPTSLAPHAPGMRPVASPRR